MDSRAAKLDNVDQWAESNNPRSNRAKSAEIIFTDCKRKPTHNLPRPVHPHRAFKARLFTEFTDATSEKFHRWQSRHRPIGHIMPIHTLHTTLRFQYQLFGNVRLKLINSSAINPTIGERIPLIYYPVTKSIFSNI